MTISETSKKFDLTTDTLRYYERVGMIPPVNRQSNGIRNYTEKDIRWVELAKCMREAGLPVEVMIEYVALYRQGDSTIPARLTLLMTQHNNLIEQRKKLDITIDKLNYKIGVYQKAVKNGKLESNKF